MQKVVDKTEDLYYGVSGGGRGRQRMALNSPSYAYKAVFGKEPDFWLPGRGDHPQKIWHDIPVDEEMPEDVLDQLEEIREIEGRASCAGHRKRNPTYFVFRLASGEDEKASKVSAYLRKKGLASLSELGSGGRPRIIVAADLYPDQEEWQQWWQELPNQIQKAVKSVTVSERLQERLRSFRQSNEQKTAADKNSEEWIGVDLDATLAVYRGWKGPKHIGKPIPKMVARVKRWLKEGKKVKIFTARVSGDNGAARRAIQKFCKKVFGQVLPITNRKDQFCKTVWDDRSHNMKANTGDQMNKAAFLKGYKTAQHLENVETLEPLTNRELARAVRDAVIAEQDAIKQYETVADSSTDSNATQLLQDIADEEKVHIGELQQLLARLDPSNPGFLQEGQQEAAEMKSAFDEQMNKAAYMQGYMHREGV